MSFREAGWLIFLAGLPFAHHFSQIFSLPLDIWQAQAAWSQLWIIVLFFGNIGSRNKQPALSNKPLACFLTWVGLLSLSMWVKTMCVQKAYPLSMLQATTHVILLVFFYQAAVSTWNVQFLAKLFKVLAWTGVIVMGYCFIQLFSLDQFYRDIDNGQPWAKDRLVGTIGNPTHLSAYLAMMLPLFLLQKGRIWKVFTGICLAILYFTHSITGWICATAVTTWWLWYNHRKWLWAFVLIIPLAIVWLKFNMNEFNPYGRLIVWPKFYEIFHEKSITGIGLGYIYELSKTIKNGDVLFQWRHVHNEYFQMAIETGLIGLGLIFWMICSTVRKIAMLQKTPLLIACAGILIAFGLNCMTNFPAHLWLLGSMALIAYCGIEVILREEASG